MKQVYTNLKNALGHIHNNEKGAELIEWIAMVAVIFLLLILTRSCFPGIYTKFENNDIDTQNKDQHISSNDEDLDKGLLTITYPAHITLSNESIITIELLANSQYTDVNSSEPHITGLIEIDPSKYLTGERKVISEVINVYPIMMTELFATDLAIAGSQKERRLMYSGSAAWVWQVSGKDIGDYSFTINLYGEITHEDEKFTVLEKSILENINILPNNINN